MHTVPPLTPIADHKPLSKSSSSELEAVEDPLDEDPEHKKGGAKGGPKRSKYRTEEERVCKEKERRNANNQRER